MGLRPGTLVDRAFVQGHFPSLASYQEFVLEYLKNRQLPDELEVYLNDWES